MVSFLNDWLDSRLGIAASTEPQRALLQNRFAALKRQLPWLYGILFANLLGLHLTITRDTGLFDAPAALLLAATAYRTVYWLRMRRRDLSSDALKLEMRKTFVIASLFCAGACVWCIMLYQNSPAPHRIDVIMFASLAAIGCCYGMSSFPAAAATPLVILAIPLASMLMTSANAAHIGVGISLLLLSVLTIRLLNLQDDVFRGLVRSRFEIEVEKKRAVIAEKIALAEQSRVRTIANSDPLTGLANRRGLLTAFSQHDGHGALGRALILIDLDGFKPINDTFGHASGDALLIEVSHRLQALPDLRGSVARLGGDEFALIHECSSDPDALEIARAAIDLIAKPFSIAGRRMEVSASAGISCHHVHDIAEAMRRADIALYEAKSRGRGSVALFCNDMEQSFQRRTTIEQALREPGFAGQIELAFQPIFHLETMDVASFEALARWRHSELGWIPPSEFIPITEQISVLDEISDSLLRRAAAAASEWPRSVRLSFNLSAVQLCSADTASNVLSILAEKALDPARFQIEVTETALLADFDLARRNLAALRDRGVRIVLDDFGAGYASISYLREINFDAVKLDGSLISSITEVGSGLPLLQGVLALCRAMGQQCVAEHIETDRQVKLLQQLGCRYGQGFGLAFPMDSGAAAELANAGRMNTTLGPRHSSWGRRAA